MSGCYTAIDTRQYIHRLFGASLCAGRVDGSLCRSHRMEGILEYRRPDNKRRVGGGNDGVSVAVCDGRICVDGVGETEMIKVYSTGGMLVGMGLNRQVEVPSPGV